MQEHVPVLPQEILSWLAVKPAGFYVDATAGQGGHSRLILEKLGPEGRLLCVDWDPSHARELAARHAGDPRVRTVHENFAHLAECVGPSGPEPDGIIFDLGFSRDQVMDAGRGFSFQQTGLLDMRFDAGQGRPAWQLLQESSPDQLETILREYGEERRARQIARAVCSSRPRPRTTEELARLVMRIARGRDRIHPATRTFQALRIAVNREMENLDAGLQAALERVKVGGRVCVIDFHSLEDRKVKHFFVAQKQAGRLRILTRKPVRPTEAEAGANPSSRSAKLRVGEKIA